MRNEGGKCLFCATENKGSRSAPLIFSKERSLAKADLLWFGILLLRTLFLAFHKIINRLRLLFRKFRRLYGQFSEERAIPRYNEFCELDGNEYEQKEHHAPAEALPLYGKKGHDRIIADALLSQFISFLHTLGDFGKNSRYG